jgi:hypothetical protein
MKILVTSTHTHTHKRLPGRPNNKIKTKKAYIHCGRKGFAVHIMGKGSLLTI